MNWLFGDGPENQQNSDTVWVASPTQLPQKDTTPIYLAQENDVSLEDRIKIIINHIWKAIKEEWWNGVIINQNHNSVINTTISKIEFKWAHDMCVVTFNDRVDDDDFEIEWDMDHDPSSLNDVYAVRVHTDKSFIIEKGHPDEYGVLHFHPIEHEEKITVITFAESCMNITNT